MLKYALVLLAAATAASAALIPASQALSPIYCNTNAQCPARTTCTANQRKNCQMYCTDNGRNCREICHGYCSPPPACPKQKKQPGKLVIAC